MNLQKLYELYSLVTRRRDSFPFRSPEWNYQNVNCNNIWGKILVEKDRIKSLSELLVKE